MPMEKIEYEIDLTTDESQGAKPPSGSFSIFDDDDDVPAQPAARTAAKPAAGADGDADDEIEIVPDEPVPGKKAAAAAADDEPLDDAVSEDEMATYSERVKKRISQMTRKQREAERRAQELANENASAVEVLRRQQAKLQELSTLIKNGETQYVTAATAVHESQVLAAKAALRAAMEEGDPDKVADAQTALTIAVTNHQQAQAYQPVAPKVEQEVEQLARPTPTTQATPDYEPDPAAKAWMGKNKWFAKPADTTERLMRNMAIEYANSLESQGYDPIADADAYYTEINKVMRQRFPEKFPAARTPSSESTRAPTAGAVQNPGAPAKQKIKLTESQVRLARKMGIPLAEYAKEFARMYGTT